MLMCCPYKLHLLRAYEQRKQDFKDRKHRAVPPSLFARVPALETAGKKIPQLWLSLLNRE